MAKQKWEIVWKSGPFIRAAHTEAAGIFTEFDSQVVLESPDLSSGIGVFKNLNHAEKDASIVVKFANIVRVRSITLGKLGSKCGSVTQPADNISIAYYDMRLKKWVRSVKNYTVHAEAVDEVVLTKPVICRLMRFTRRDKLCLGQIIFS